MPIFKVRKHTPVLQAEQANLKDMLSMSPEIRAALCNCERGSHKTVHLHSGTNGILVRHGDWIVTLGQHRYEVLTRKELDDKYELIATD